MSFPNRNALWAAALVDELARCGVRHACVSPGSRSTPLALAFLRDPRFRTFVHLDERSGAFFGLGLAKRSGAPVVLVCTSGTAAANFFPAIVEAAVAHVPLLVLTADRPPEARDWGAAQTIDQVGIFGRYARWAVDLPCPEPSAPMLAYLRQTAARAAATASAHPRGPVHLNLPFRDPLPPIEVPGDVPAGLGDGARGEGPTLRLAETRTLPSDRELQQVAAQLARTPHGAIALGPLTARPELAASLRALAEATGYPVLAEVTTGLRHRGVGPNLVAHPDLLARSDAFVRAHPLSLVLRLGQAHTTRQLSRYIDTARETVLLAEPGTFVDPGHRAAVHLAGDLPELLERLAAAVRAQGPARDAAWLEDFRGADEVAGSTLGAMLSQEKTLGELNVARELYDALPEGVPLYVASSMPIRDLEATAPLRAAPAAILANRGANGIDGTIASALGAAAASGDRAALLIGDVAFLHDLTALQISRTHGLSLTAVLINNDGGGIFSFLEVAQAVDAAAFEKLWGTPHGAAFGPAAVAFGARHVLASSREELRGALDASFRSSGVQIIEVRTRRDENVEAHRRVLGAVGQALEAQRWRSSS